MGEKIPQIPLKPEEIIRKTTAEADEILGRVVKPVGNIEVKPPVNAGQKTVNRLEKVREDLKALIQRTEELSKKKK